MSDEDLIWERTKAELRSMPQYLVAFLRSPLEKIKICPQWEWPTILILQGILAMFSGALAGLVKHSFADFLGGLIVLPLSSAIVLAIGSGFFYYTFSLFLKRDLSFKSIFTLMVLSGIPFLIFRILFSIVSAVQLVGLAFSAALLIVGFTENFMLPRKFVLRLILGIYSVFLVSWAVHQIQQAQLSYRPKTDVTPESWKILEKEINQNEGE